MKQKFMLKKENLIELRVTWKIPIMMENTTDWQIYVDVMNREIVGIIQEL
jgi:hypothetical protein